MARYGIVSMISDAGGDGSELSDPCSSLEVEYDGSDEKKEHTRRDKWHTPGA